MQKTGKPVLGSQAVGCGLGRTDGNTAGLSIELLVGFSGKNECVNRRGNIPPQQCGITFMDRQPICAERINPRIQEDASAQDQHQQHCGIKDQDSRGKKASSGSPFFLLCHSAARIRVGELQIRIQFLRFILFFHRLNS